MSKKRKEVKIILTEDELDSLHEAVNNMREADMSLNIEGIELKLTKEGSLSVRIWGKCQNEFSENLYL